MRLVQRLGDAQTLQDAFKEINTQEPPPLIGVYNISRKDRLKIIQTKEEFAIVHLEGEEEGIEYIHPYSTNLCYFIDESKD